MDVNSHIIIVFIIGIFSAPLTHKVMEFYQYEAEGFEVTIVAMMLNILNVLVYGFTKNRSTDLYKEKPIDYYTPKPKMKIKKTVLQKIVEDDDISEFEDKVNDVMQQLRSSDFNTKKGLNEAGLKMILMGILISDPYYSSTKDLYIESELPVPSKDHSKVNVKKVDYFKNAERYNNFLDLTIISPDRVALIELKYVKMKFLRPSKKQEPPTKLGESEWRPKLQEWVKFMDKLDKEGFLNLKVSSFIENKAKVTTVENLIKATGDDQGARYKRLYRFRFENIPEKLRPKNTKISPRKIKVYIGIGVGNRFVIEEYKDK